jgi:hypothetical protein
MAHETDEICPDDVQLPHVLSDPHGIVRHNGHSPSLVTLGNKLGSATCH